MKNRPLIKSFNYAIDGIVYVLRTQRNMRIHFAAAAVVLGVALFFDLKPIEYIALFFAISFVMVAELLNTAIESAIDLTTTTHDPIAQIAKDVAAAAVLISGINALFVGYLVFFYRLNPFTLALLKRVKQSPVHLTVISLLLVVIVVIAAKAMIGGGKFLHGGWPSGHSAIAAALFTAIAFLSNTPIVATLGLAMALLVFHSRVEAGIHTTLEIISGALLGTLVTVVVFQIFYA